MDVQMPDKDGIEATIEIRRLEATLMRANQRTRRTPIVALTALARPGDQNRCLDEGMDAFLSKPVRSADLLALLERVAKDAAPAVIPAVMRP